MSGGKIPDRGQDDANGDDQNTPEPDLQIPLENFQIVLGGHFLANGFGQGFGCVAGLFRGEAGGFKPPSQFEGVEGYRAHAYNIGSGAKPVKDARLT